MEECKIESSDGKLILKIYFYL